jgi:hypothetical protein
MAQSVTIVALKAEIRSGHLPDTSWKPYHLSLLIQRDFTLRVHGVVCKVLSREHYFLSIMYPKCVCVCMYGCMYVFVPILPHKTRRVCFYAIDNMNQSFYESFCNEARPPCEHMQGYTARVFQDK